MRRALAAVLGAVILATLSGAASTASSRAGIVDYFALVTYRGTGKAEHTFQKVTAHMEYSFEQVYFFDVEDRNGISNYTLFPLDSLSGIGYGTWTNTESSCSVPFASAHDTAHGMSDGVHSWFSHQQPSGLPDPGPGNVLITADPFWYDTKAVGKVPPNCAGQFSMLGVDNVVHHQLRCVIEPGKNCSKEWSSGPVHDGCGAGDLSCDRGQAVTVMEVKSYVSRPDFWPLLELNHDYGLFFQIANLYSIPPPRYFEIPPLIDIPTTVKIPPTDDGELDGQVKIAKQPLIQLHGPIKLRSPSRVALIWSPAGLALLHKITQPTLLTVTLTLTPAKGKAVSMTQTAYALPTSHTTGTGGGAGTPTITSITLGGSPASPIFAIHGTNFGTKPAPSPAGHPSGLNGCPVIAGDNGYDYGTNLYIVVPAKNWSGGRYRPSSSETDCLDLVVTRYAPTEIDFGFGPFHTKFASKFVLANGDLVQVVVESAEKTVHAAYGKTVTN